MAEKMLSIDGEKFRSLLMEKCGSLSEAGRNVGKSSKFFGNFIRMERIPEYAMLLADSVLGVPYESYAPAKPASEPVEQEDCEWCVIYKQVVGEPWRTIKYCPKCGKLLGGE